ncbi:MAG: hypothetical protein H6813_03610 [Phycisphaeraceae bacterium]|nr:hypothetical protein [Phycisphaeraceae bacterium]
MGNPLKENAMESEERICRLEKSNLRMMIFAVLASVLAALSLFMQFQRSAGVPDVVRAKAFHVVSDEGVPVAKIESTFGLGSIDGHQFGTLQLLDDDSKSKIQMMADDSGSNIEVFNSKSYRIVSLGSTNMETGFIGVASSTGGKLVELSSTYDAEGTISIYNKSNKELVRIGASKNGSGYMTVQNKDEQPRIMMGCSDFDDGFFWYLRKG